MFADIALTLKDYLKSLCVAGGLLEGIQLVRIGDWDAIPKEDHPAVTIEPFEDLQWRDNGNHLDSGWDIQVQLYTLATAHDGDDPDTDPDDVSGAEAALLSALELYWTDTGETGTDEGAKGLLVALAAIKALGPTPSGHTYLFSISDRPTKGVAKLGDGSWLCCISTTVSVRHKRVLKVLP